MNIETNDPSPTELPPPDGRASVEAGARSPDASSVSLFQSATAGLCCAILFYLVLGLGFRNSYVGQIFFDRGWVTMLEAFLAGWAACFMGLKLLQVRRQRALTGQTRLPNQPIEVNSAADAQAIVRTLEASGAAVRGGTLHRRLLQAFRHFLRHPNRAAVTDLLDAMAVTDASRADSSYTVLRVMIWAIPIVGFIGTVVGLGTAVGGFADSLPKVSDFAQLKGTLAGVTSGLSVAFDATFVALLLSLILMFPASLLEKAEQDHLLEVDEYCRREVLGRLSDHPVTSTRTDPQSTHTIETVLKTIQEHLKQWLVTASHIIGNDVNAALRGVKDAADDVKAAVEGLAGTVTRIEGGSSLLATAVGRAKQDADAVAQFFSMARSEAEVTSASLAAASRSAAAIPGPLHQASGHAEDVADALGTAATHAGALPDPARRVEHHLAAAATAAALLERGIERALAAATTRFNSDVQSQVAQCQHLAAALSQASEKLVVSMNQASAHPPAHPNGVAQAVVGGHGHPVASHQVEGLPA